MASCGYEVVSLFSRHARTLTPRRQDPQCDSLEKELDIDGSRRKVGVDGSCRNDESRMLERTRMAKELPSLGELEIRVLRLVWQQQPCTERQITDAIQQERSVGRTTVLKTIQR